MVTICKNQDKVLLILSILSNVSKYCGEPM